MNPTTPDGLRLYLNLPRHVNRLTAHSTHTGWQAGTTVTLDTLTDQTVPGEYNGNVIAVTKTTSVVDLTELMRSPAVAVTPGEFVGACFTIGLRTQTAVARTFRVSARIAYYDSIGLEITPAGYGAWDRLGDIYYTPGEPVTSQTFTLQARRGTFETRRYLAPAPAGAATCRLLIAVTPLAGTPPFYGYVARAAVARGPHDPNGNYGGVTGVAFHDGTPPIDLTGDSYEIKTEIGNTADTTQFALDPGTLTATITGDPEDHSQVRRGASLTLLVSGNTPWEGEVEEITTSIDPTTGKATSTITATDQVTTLAQRDNDGVQVGIDTGSGGTIFDPLDRLLWRTPVRYILPAPTDHGYSGFDPGGGLFLSHVTGGRASDDALALARTGGYHLFGNAVGVVARTAAQINADTPTGDRTFTDNPSAPAVQIRHNAIDIGFDSKAFPNSVLVLRKHRDEDQGDGTSEKTYGPYIDPASIAEWGENTATIEVLDGVPRDHAARVLATFGEDAEVPRSITWPIRRGVPSSINAFDGVRPGRTVKIEHLGETWTRLVLKVSITADPYRASATAHLGPVPPAGTPPLPSSRGGDPEAGPPVDTWNRAYGCRSRDSAQSIPSAAWTAVVLTVNEGLAGGMDWDSSNSRFVVPFDGLYTINGNVRWAAGGASYRGAGIFINGALRRYTYDDVTATGLAVSSAVSATLRLTAGDTVQMRVYQGLTTALNTLAGASGATALDLVYLGP